MNLWETETPIAEIPDLEIDIPAWIEPDISPNDIASICQGGCASGAYMPAVTYHQAIKTMSDHGDDVLQFIEDQMGELPAPNKGESWSGLACFYLSYAVDLWASSIESTLEDFEIEDTGETP